MMCEVPSVLIAGVGELEAIWRAQVVGFTRPAPSKPSPLRPLAAVQRQQGTEGGGGQSGGAADRVGSAAVGQNIHGALMLGVPIPPAADQSLPTQRSPWLHADPISGATQGLRLSARRHQAIRPVHGDRSAGARRYREAGADMQEGRAMWVRSPRKAVRGLCVTSYDRYAHEPRSP